MLQGVATVGLGLWVGEVVVNALLELACVASADKEHLVVILETGVWRAAEGRGNHDERQAACWVVIDVNGIAAVVEFQIVYSGEGKAVGFVERDGSLVVHEAGFEHHDGSAFEGEHGVVEIAVGYV